MKIQIGKISLVLFYLTLVACTSPATQEYTTAVITLERTACFGVCPVYKLTIYEDGRVEYDGQQFVEVTGKQTAEITPEQVKELVSDFQNADYFDLEDEYVAPVTDIPSAITSITLDGKFKTVRNYGGCMEDSPVKAPEALCELEIKIDELTNSAQWIGSVGLP
jgi:hypothetical protein